MNRWLSSGLVVILIILAGSTAYFASKATVLDQAIKRGTITTAVTTSAPESSASTSPSSSVSTAATTTATTSPIASATPSATASASPTSTAAVITVSSSDRLSQFAQTHAVASGESLAGIGASVSVPWLRIADANNLQDPYPIKIGQNLIIPSVVSNSYEVDYTSDPAKVTSAQSATTGGKNAWRLDPGQVAQAENAGVYGLGSSDTYQVATKDDKAGTATVNAVKTSDTTKTYTITLTQPATKGATGIWVISKVSAKS